MIYERQATMSTYDRRPRKKNSVEITVIPFFLLVLAFISAWLPYFFTQLILTNIAIP